MTRWQDITPEERRRWHWVEVTAPGEERTFVKGGDRVPDDGRNRRRWEYRQFVVPHTEARSDATERRLNVWGDDGWEVVAVQRMEEWATTAPAGALPPGYITVGPTLVAELVYVLKREVPA